MPNLHDHSQEFLSFHLGDEEYAIEILKVQEIRNYEPATPISNSPDFLKGVINLRGTIVPIIDLRILFKLPKVEYTQFTIVIILNLSRWTLGIVVDSVSDVITLGKDDIKQPPDLGTLVNSQYIRGMAPMMDQMLIILDIEALMDMEELKDVDKITQTSE